MKNSSQFVITNIQIFLTSIPAGLEARKDRHRIEMLKPESFESPTFKLKATESCVGDKVEGLVSYTDHSGKQKTINMQPLEIHYVCNLLVPKEISKKEFDARTIKMDGQKFTIVCDGSIEEVESSLSGILKDSNFYILDQPQEAKGETFRKIDGYAQGKYDTTEVGLSIVLQKLEEHSRLIIKVMSEDKGKVMDILKDISEKCDNIKSDTELIKEYTSQIEDILEKQEDLEAYLKEHLGSDFEKIKIAWYDYKAGKINKKQLIKEGIRVIGKKFVKKLIVKLV